MVLLLIFPNSLSCDSLNLLLTHILCNKTDLNFRGVIVDDNYLVCISDIYHVLILCRITASTKVPSLSHLVIDMELLDTRIISLLKNNSVRCKRLPLDAQNSPKAPLKESVQSLTMTAICSPNLWRAQKSGYLACFLHAELGADVVAVSDQSYLHSFPNALFAFLILWCISKSKESSLPK